MYTHLFFRKSILANYNLKFIKYIQRYNLLKYSFYKKKSKCTLAIPYRFANIHSLVFFRKNMLANYTFECI